MRTTQFKTAFLDELVDKNRVDSHLAESLYTDILKHNKHFETSVIERNFKNTQLPDSEIGKAYAKSFARELRCVDGKFIYSERLLTTDLKAKNTARTRQHKQPTFQNDLDHELEQGLQNRQEPPVTNDMPNAKNDDLIIDRTGSSQPKFTKQFDDEFDF